MINASRQPNVSLTLSSAVWPAGPGVARVLRLGALVGGGALALTLSARAEVPLFIPITLQSLVVLVLGATLGARLAAGSVLLYLGEGLANLPVFAGTPEKGIGLTYMMGPTGGYLVGFLLAAAFVGACAERGLDRSFWKLLCVISLGHAIIFAAGFAWLGHFVGADKAFVLGVAPFYAATVIKTLLATALVFGSWQGLAWLRS